MMRLVLGLMTAAIWGAFVPTSSIAGSECSPLNGELDTSDRSGSGWLDLATPTNFGNGDTLVLSIGGSATRVLVRLLTKGQPHAASEGIIGGIREVPKERSLAIALPDNERDIVQISVHGGTKPWDWNLGPENGPATLEQACVIHHSTDASRTPPAPDCRLLVGRKGGDPEWNSGWIDLAEPTAFRPDDVLQLTIGGSASKVIVRLLARGKSPEQSDGAIPHPFPVPADRVIRVVVKGNQSAIVQISVHGGPNPWNKFPLGADNGAATLENACVIRGTARQADRP